MGIVFRATAGLFEGPAPALSKRKEERSRTPARAAVPNVVAPPLRRPRWMLPAAIALVVAVAVSLWLFLSGSILGMRFNPRGGRDQQISGIVQDATGGVVPDVFVRCAFRQRRNSKWAD